MIYPEIKYTFSPDIDNLSFYAPDEPDQFGFLLGVVIGPKGGKGAELFQVTVCTPKWLSQHFAKDEIILGRHYLILFEYNHERLVKRIDKYLQQCSGETWQEVAQKVGRLGLWEFEDYKEFKG